MTSTAEFLRAPGLPAPHGFFTRRGGVSTGPFESLNCALSGADDRANVLRNRALAAEAIGADSAQLVGLFQVHGADVIRVNQPWAPGEGPKADAMVTDHPNIALGIISADCAPVLFTSPTGDVVGAAHAGWRGALAGVLEATVSALRNLGAPQIHAVIGPCIGPASYEVAADLRDAVLARDPSDAQFFGPGNQPDRWQFDLPGYCVARLTAAGAAVHAMYIDTLSEPDRFFSHRRRTLAGGGQIGHQISIIRPQG